MSLTGIARRLTKGELAREPRSLAVVAWFDGWARGQNPHARRDEYPRRLTSGEAKSWRDGFREGRRGVRCHAAHGFTPCPGEHP